MASGSSTILANITGLRPVGYRAPLYEITYATTGLLAKHGFLYASNLQDSLWPYRHADAPSLVELPASWILDDGPFFAFGLRPNLYRQIFPPSAVLSVWREEFLGIHGVGGLTMLILHPQYTGRPSRLAMLQTLVDEFRAAIDPLAGAGKDHPVLAYDIAADVDLSLAAALLGFIPTNANATPPRFETHLAMSAVDAALLANFPLFLNDLSSAEQGA